MKLTQKLANILVAMAFQETPRGAKPGLLNWAVTYKGKRWLVTMKEWEKQGN